MNEKEKKSYRAALIDMDGVLYDSMKYHARAWRQMMLENGLDIPEQEFFLCEGMTGRATIELLVTRTRGIKPSEQECSRMYQRKTELFHQLGRKELMPGTGDVLSQLQAANIRCIVVTGSGQRSLFDSIQSDYPGIFANGDMVTALDVTAGKPNPEPYLKGLALAGVSANEALVIENAPLGVQSASQTGCYTIGVNTGPLPKQSLINAGADKIFNSMTELAEQLPSIIRTDEQQ